MTIDELLQAAGEACQAALAVMSIDDAEACAAVAQACAQTAQAMILRSMTFDGVDGKLALYVVTP